jgi:hypothetical protein
MECKTSFFAIFSECSLSLLDTGLPPLVTGFENSLWPDLIVSGTEPTTARKVFTKLGHRTRASHALHP